MGDPGIPNAFNRYLYVFNNPLSLTDVTGNCPFCFALIFAAAVAVEKVVLKMAVVEILKSVGLMALNGAIAGGASAGIQGGNIIEGILFGGLQGALPIAIGNPAGVWFGNLLGGTGVATVAGNFIGQGLVGGALSVGRGGSFASGFLAAGVGSLPKIDIGPIGNVIEAAVLGGAASALGGGKFENGAMTAAFSYVARSLAEEEVASANSKTRGRSPANRTVGIAAMNEANNALREHGILDSGYKELNDLLADWSDVIQSIATKYDTEILSKLFLRNGEWYAGTAWSDGASCSIGRCWVANLGGAVSGGQYWGYIHTHPTNLCTPMCFSDADLWQTVLSGGYAFVSLPNRQIWQSDWKHWSGWSIR